MIDWLNEREVAILAIGISAGFTAAFLFVLIVQHFA